MLLYTDGYSSAMLFEEQKEDIILARCNTKDAYSKFIAEQRTESLF